MSVSLSFSRGRVIAVPVLMQHEGAPQCPDMALDTGARMTVITPGFAQGLGLEPDEAQSSTRSTGCRVEAESVQEAAAKTGDPRS